MQLTTNRIPLNCGTGSRHPENKGGQSGYAIAEVLTKAFADMKGNYYRDYLMDIVGMLGEVELRPHGRLTFGLTQRYLYRAELPGL